MLLGRTDQSGFSENAITKPPIHNSRLDCSSQNMSRSRSQFMSSFRFLQPIHSRAISNSSPSNPKSFRHEFLSLIQSLSQNPNNPKTLISIDVLLTHSKFLDTSTSLLVLRGLSLTNKITRSKQLLSNLSKSNRLSNTFVYSVLLQCILRHGTIRDVESAWGDIDNGSSIDVSDFIIFLCQKSEVNGLEIENICLRILSNSYRVSYECYLAMIGATCKSNPSLGKSILNEMTEKGFEIDDFSYFTVFRSFCQVGNVQEADSVLRMWRSRRQFDMDVSIYGHFFFGLCKSSMFREARKLFQKLTGKSKIESDSYNIVLKPGRRAIFQITRSDIIPETVAFEAYFRALCKFGKVKEAESLLKVALKQMIVPQTCVYTCFIKSLCKAGRIDDALRFYKAQVTKGYISCKDIGVAIVFGLCDCGRVDDGVQFLDEMISEGFVCTSRVHNRIMKSFWDVGDEEKAMDVFKKMVPDNETYSIAMYKFLDKMEVDKAICFLEEMSERKLKASIDLYSGIVRCLCECGRVEESERWVNRMIEDDVLVSYDRWEKLCDSIGLHVTSEFWQCVDVNMKKVEFEKKNKWKGR